VFRRKILRTQKPKSSPHPAGDALPTHHQGRWATGRLRDHRRASGCPRRRRGRRSLARCRRARSIGRAFLGHIAHATSPPRPNRATKHSGPIVHNAPVEKLIHQYCWTVVVAL
jgi:hypothetical protein